MWGLPSEEKKLNISQEGLIGDVGSTVEKGRKHPVAQNITTVEQSKQIIEDENPKQGNMLDDVIGVNDHQNNDQIKHLKSSWMKASYNNTVRRIHEPPKSIEELKVVLCNRF